MKTWFISKYVLSSRAIQTIEAEAKYPDYAPTGFVSYGSHGLLYIGRDVFATVQEASVDAEARRLKKIASLKKQIAKLENMDFTKEEQ